MDGCRNCLGPKGFVQTWGIPGFHSVWPGILFPYLFEHNLNLRFGHPPVSNRLNMSGTILWHAALQSVL